MTDHLLPGNPIGLHGDTGRGEPVALVLHIVRGKSERISRVPVTRADLLTLIEQGARLLRQGEQ